MTIILFVILQRHIILSLITIELNLNKYEIKIINNLKILFIMY